MKKLGIVALVLVAVIIVFGILAAVAGVFTRSWSLRLFSNRSWVTVNQTETLELGNATKLTIEAVDAAITVVPVSEGTTVTAKLTGEVAGNIDIELEAKTSSDGKSLTIITKYDEKFLNFGIISRQLALKVAVPVAFTGDMNVVNVSGKVSADFSAFDELEAVDVLTVSGRIEIANLKAKGLTARSVSGGIELTDCKLDADVSAVTTSGGIELVGCSAENLEARSISGSVNAAGDIQNWLIKTTSGRVTAEPERAPASLDIESISGRVDLQLPEDARFEADFDSVSGNVRNEFGDMTPNNGEFLPVYSIDTTSGAINVEK